MRVPWCPLQSSCSPLRALSFLSFPAAGPAPGTGAPWQRSVATLRRPVLCLLVPTISVLKFSSGQRWAPHCRLPPHAEGVAGASATRAAQPPPTSPAAAGKELPLRGGAEGAGRPSPGATSEGAHRPRPFSGTARLASGSVVTPNTGLRSHLCSPQSWGGLLAHASMQVVSRFLGRGSTQAGQPLPPGPRVPSSGQRQLQHTCLDPRLRAAAWGNPCPSEQEPLSPAPPQGPLAPPSSGRHR